MAMMTAICPNCGHENRVNDQLFAPHVNHVVCCDVDEGGCDDIFVFKYQKHVTFEVQVAKVTEFVPNPQRNPT